MERIAHRTSGLVSYHCGSRCVCAASLLCFLVFLIGVGMTSNMAIPMPAPIEEAESLSPSDATPPPTPRAVGVESRSGAAAVREEAVQPTEENREPRLGTVRSLAELRQFCHSHAPELEAASWVAGKMDSIAVRARHGSLAYFIEAAPVCLDSSGEVYVDPVHFVTSQSVLASHVSYPLNNLTDETFRLGSQQGFAEAVPAIALLSQVRWADTHIWHLIRDCIGGLMMFFFDYNRGEMLRLPTQTILLRGSKQSWIDRYGDTVKKMRLSALVLNSLSSPVRGGPFYETSPIYLVRQKDKPLSPRASHALERHSPSQPVMKCFCQAMEVHKKVMIHSIDAEIFYGLQDLIVRRFGEDDYLTGYSFEETDRRRRASHPWASQFWNESTFDVNGTYRPRALVIHRQSRLIGNYDLFVDHLRKLNFRVEEIFPERLPLEQQYHLGRYADLLVGMHGLGVAHAFWMDRFPIGCRTVVEFRPWVYVHQPVDLYRILGNSMQMNYYYPIPINVTFGNSISNKAMARVRLMDKANAPRVWSYPEFTDQTAYYNVAEVLQMFGKIRAHLEECLPLSQAVRRTTPIKGYQ